RDALRFTLLQKDFALHPLGALGYWTDAVATVDEPGQRYRIAVTSGPHQNNDEGFTYPFMGRRLQNQLVYVPVSGDGHVAPLGGCPADALDRTANFGIWRLRLRKEHVTRVVAFEPPSVELGWMENDPAEFARLAGDTQWGIFKVQVAPDGP